MRELHLQTSAIVREAAAGEIVVVTRRGMRVVELHPYPRCLRKQAFPDREAWLVTFPQVPGDSGKSLEEDRS